uniref:Uncharacterized protein n=1 Tax=Romanomermis culicivorax TaxID=13658 RepID=A0A915I0U1_ROMCU
MFVKYYKMYKQSFVQQYNLEDCSEAIATKFCTPEGHWWRNSKGVEWANYTMCFTENTRHQFALLLHLWCRLLHILSIYFLISNYAWMFSEGAYLQFIVQFPFVPEAKVYAAATVVG